MGESEKKTKLDRDLLAAAEKGSIDDVKILLNQGATINDERKGVLHNAVANGHTDLVDFLLKHGADIHAFHDSALKTAVHCGHTETVALLIERGANISLYRDEFLLNAAGDGDTKMVSFLLDHGADINAVNEDGNSVLCLTIQNEHTQTASLLLSRRADFRANDNSALGLAIFCARNKEITKMLISRYRYEELRGLKFSHLPEISKELDRRQLERKTLRGDDLHLDI